MNQRDRKLEDYVRNNLTALKHFVFFGVSYRIPLWDCYKNLCEKYGKDAMEYIDFEFWYMRFYNGELDMDYDRSQDPQPRQITQLPLEIKDKILRNLDPIEWRMIRKTCKHFRALIDTYDPNFQYISVEINSNQTTIWLNNNKLHYEDTPFTDQSDYQYPLVRVQLGQGYGRKVMYSNHLELAFNDLSIILKNPKLKLKRLYVAIRRLNGDELKRMFEGLGRQVHTNEVEIVIEYSGGEDAVLPYLVPDTLRVILLEIKGPMHPFNTEEDIKERLNQIGTMEQCRKAENVQFRLPGLKAGLFPIESFVQCKSLSIHTSHLVRNKLTIADVLRFKKVILKSQLKHFFIESSTDFVLRALKRRLGKTVLEVPDLPNLRHIKIPKTDEYYEMDFHESDNYYLEMSIVRRSS